MNQAQVTAKKRLNVMRRKSRRPRKAVPLMVMAMGTPMATGMAAMAMEVMEARKAMEPAGLRQSHMREMGTAMAAVTTRMATATPPPRMATTEAMATVPPPPWRSATPWSTLQRARLLPTQRCRPYPRLQRDGHLPSMEARTLASARPRLPPSWHMARRPHCRRQATTPTSSTMMPAATPLLQSPQQRRSSCRVRQLEAAAACRAQARWLRTASATVKCASVSAPACRKMLLLVCSSIAPRPHARAPVWGAWSC
mmetsp:Transcript_34043/g.75488  ORF Transcript_34043/g.75488 Transcript_34043/m.75488 type:complete len:254 (+) Transcript_34043:720-1481(+)